MPLRPPPSGFAAALQAHQSAPRASGKKKRRPHASDIPTGEGDMQAMIEKESEHREAALGVKAMISKESEERVKADTGVEDRIANRERVEGEYGARFLPGGKAKQAKEKRRREMSTLDIAKVVKGLGALNDPEAVAIFDRADAAAAEAEALAAQRAAEGDEEEEDDVFTMTAKERKATAEAMKSAIRANLSTMSTLFREIDKDGSGEISTHEFEKLLARLGLNHTRYEVHDLYRHMGLKGSKNVRRRRRRARARELSRPPSRLQTSRYPRGTHTQSATHAPVRTPQRPNRRYGAAEARGEAVRARRDHNVLPDAEAVRARDDVPAAAAARAADGGRRRRRRRGADLGAARQEHGQSHRPLPQVRQGRLRRGLEEGAQGRDGVAWTQVRRGGGRRALQSGAPSPHKRDAAAMPRTSSDEPATHPLRLLTSEQFDADGSGKIAYRELHKGLAARNRGASFFSIKTGRMEMLPPKGYAPPPAHPKSQSPSPPPMPPSPVSVVPAPAPATALAPTATHATHATHATPILGVTDAAVPIMDMTTLALGAPALAGGGATPAAPTAVGAKLGLKAMVAKQMATTAAAAGKVEGMAEAAERALLLERIKQTLRKDLQRVLDLFRKWDTDGDGTVDRAEFGRAVALLGFKPPEGPTWGAAYVAYVRTVGIVVRPPAARGRGRGRAAWGTQAQGPHLRPHLRRAHRFAPPRYVGTIDALFASLDEDGSGTAEINEIEAALKGGRKQARKPRDPRLGPRDFVSPVTGQVIRAGVPCRPTAQDARDAILARSPTHDAKKARGWRDLPVGVRDRFTDAHYASPTTLPPLPPMHEDVRAPSAQFLDVDRLAERHGTFGRSASETSFDGAAGVPGAGGRRSRPSLLGGMRGMHAAHMHTPPQRRPDSKQLVRSPRGTMTDPTMDVTCIDPFGRKSGALNTSISLPTIHRARSRVLHEQVRTLRLYG